MILPEEYTTTRKTAVDLGNYLLTDESWETTYLNSPHRNLLPEEDKRHSVDNISEVDPLAVNINAKEAYMDGLIDNIIAIILDNKYGIEREKTAALLVSNTILRPLQVSETLKCDNPISIRKLSGEGKLTKWKTCLGWYIHTHSLRVFLPKENQIAWVNDIKETLSSK